MEESILISIKKLLGFDEDYTAFDTDIIIHINTTFMVLSQLGVGPTAGFRIQDASTTWNEYITEESNLEGVKTYIYCKVKLIFDPPSNSATIEALKQMINEFEWRLNIEAESK